MELFNTKCEAETEAWHRNHVLSDPFTEYYVTQVESGHWAVVKRQR